MKRGFWLERVCGAVALMALFAGAELLGGEHFEIVRDGRLTAKIIVADKPSNVARYAAEEFAKHSKRPKSMGYANYHKSLPHLT